MAQLNLVTPADTAGAHRHIGEKSNGGKANSSPSRASESTTAQRASRAAEARKDPARRPDQPAAPRLTRFNVAAPEAPATPYIPRSWLRPLLVVLILVALVPNLTLAAIVWLGLIDTPWSKQPVPPPAAVVQTAAPAAAVLTAPAALDAAAGEVIAFPIALDGTDGVPAGSIIAITGLPPGSTLSDGRPYGDTEWNLKPDQIGDLHLAVPGTANGVSKLAIKLMTPGDKIIADAETLLTAAPAPALAAEQAPSAEPAAKDPEATGSLPAPKRAEAAGEGSAAAEPPTGDAEAGSSQPADVVKTEDTSSFVQPSAYVNLRDGPSSSSRVIGVIAKGAKVPVLERKRGWLQVTNPATSEQGWIYSGYVEGGQKARPRSKRAASSDAPQQKSDSSFWNWLSQ